MCVCVCVRTVIMYAFASFRSECIWLCMNSLHPCAECTVCVCTCIHSVQPCVCLLSCLYFNLLQCVDAWVHVCLSACSVSMMALFWMIDVLEGAARSSGWARASVWHTASSLLLYICRRSKTPSPLPPDCASRTNTANTHRFLFFGLYFEASVSFLKVNWVLCAFLATSCFPFYHW